MKVEICQKPNIIQCSSSNNSEPSIYNAINPFSFYSLEALFNVTYQLGSFVIYMNICNIVSLPILQLEECAIQLWNWAITNNVGTTIGKNQKAKGRLTHNSTDDHHT